MIDGLSKIAQAQSDAVKSGTHRGTKSRGHKGNNQGHGTRDFHTPDDGNIGELDLDDITIDIIDENALLGLTDGGGGGGGNHVRSRGSASGTDRGGADSFPHLPSPLFMQIEVLMQGRGRGWRQCFS